jgi:DNA-binding response OmpR family regulator
MVAPFEKLQERWAKHRKRLEREIRVLVVDDDPAAQRELEQALHRSRIANRTVDTSDRVLDLVEREHYSLVLLADHYPEMDGLELVRKLKKLSPDVDVAISSGAPTVATLSAAFAYRVLDIFAKPLPGSRDLGLRLQQAIQRNVDRRMRNYAVQQFKEELKQLDPVTRKTTTQQLERRLSGFKRWIGDFNKVLVSEDQDPEMRRLAEDLLVSNLYVETADIREEAMVRIAERGIHLLIMKVGQREGEDVPLLIDEVHLADPLVEQILVTERPEITAAQAALQRDVASYLSWPPADTQALVVQACEILESSRNDRLMDNLLATLFWETQRATDSSPEKEFDAFCDLVGLDRAVSLDEWLGEPDAEESGVAFLGEMLDDILEREQEEEQEEHEERSTLPGLTPSEDQGSDRRAFVRVVENQFVRFRGIGAATNLLAYLGDISEGGLFIRTPHLQPRGTKLEVDVNVEYEGDGYLIRCHAEVAWLAQTDRQSLHGQGFGVKFIDPPSDVLILLQRVVHSRTLKR